jgi:N-acetylmuramoyl-L-alanine amidase
MELVRPRHEPDAAARRQARAAGDRPADWTTDMIRLRNPDRRPRGNHRIRRDLVQGAIDDNLALIAGRRPPGARNPRHPRFWVTWVLVVCVAALLTATVGPFSVGRAGGTQPEPPGLANPPFDAPALPGRIATPPRAIAPSVFDLRIKRVVIDPGHGGDDPGARSRSGLAEKNVTLDIAVRLRSMLSAAGFEVVMTRERDAFISLRDRVRLANRAEGDVFVSIHVNSIPQPLRRGVETYYLGPTDDPHVERLAGAENSASGYALADFRTLLERVYVDVRGDESRRLADAVQRKLFAALRRTNPRLEDRGVKQAPFVVLIGTEMPSVLAEVSCVSHHDEAEQLRQPTYRDQIARALAAGVLEYAAPHGAPLLVAAPAAGAP